MKKKIFILFTVLTLGLTLNAQFSTDMILGKNSRNFTFQEDTESWNFTMNASMKKSENVFSDNLSFNVPLTEKLSLEFSNPVFSKEKGENFELDFTDTAIRIKLQFLNIEKDSKDTLLYSDFLSLNSGKNLKTEIHTEAADSIISTSANFKAVFRELQKTAVETELKTTVFTSAGKIKFLNAEQNTSVFRKTTSIEFEASKLMFSYTFSEGTTPVFGGTYREYEIKQSGKFSSGKASFSETSKAVYGPDGGKEVTTEYVLTVGKLELETVLNRTSGAGYGLSYPEISLSCEKGTFSLYKGKFYVNLRFYSENCELILNQDRTVQIILKFEE